MENTKSRWINDGKWRWNLAFSILTICAIAAVTRLPITSAQTASGFQINAETTTFSQVSGGVLVQNSTATITASTGTWSYLVSNSNGTTSNVSFVVERPIRYYCVNESWSIPRDVVLTTSEACVVQNPFIYNTTNGLAGGVLGPGPKPAPINRTNNAMPLGLSWGDVESQLTVVGCSDAIGATGGLVSAFGGPCSPGGGGLTAQEFTQYASAVSNQFGIIESLLGGLQTWESEANQQFQFIINTQQATLGFAQASLYATGNLSLVVQNQQAQIQTIASETTSNFQTVQGELVQVATNANNLSLAFSAFATTTVSVFNQTLYQQALNNEAIVTQLNNLTSAINTLAASTSNRFVATQQAISQIAAILQALATQSQYLPILVPIWKLQQQWVQSLNVGGRNYQFFVDGLGPSGAPNVFDLPQSLVSFFIDIPQIRYIFTSGDEPFATPVAATSQLQYQCGGLWASLNNVPITTWTGFVNSLGPAGCTTNTTLQGLNFCNCWIEIVETGCTMNQTAPVGFGVVDPGALQRWIAWNLPSFPLLGSPFAFCLGPPAPLTFSFPNTTITTSTQLNAYQTALCDRGINPTVGVPQGYQVFSVYFQTYIFVPYSGGACTADMLTIMNPPSASAATLFYVAIEAFMIPAFSMQATSIAAISEEIQGGVPNNATFVPSPFQRASGNVLSDCLTMYVVAYDVSQFVTLYKYNYLETTSNVAVYLDGVLFSVDVNPTVINDNSDLLPPDGSYIAGIAGSNGLWRTSVYDMAYSTTVPNENPFGRIGNPFYGSFPTQVGQPLTAVNYNITNWYAQNLFPFDHSAASSSIAKWQQALTCDNTYNPPRCVCNDTAPAIISTGNICDMLEWYQVSLGQIFGSCVAVGFSSPFDQVQLTISVPTGQLIATAGSNCPIVTPTQDSNFNQQTLNLYNTLATDNEIQVVVTGVPTCTYSQLETLSAFSVFPLTIEFCPDQPVGQPLVITFFNNPSGLGFFTQCNGTFNVTIYPENPAVYSPSLIPTFETVNTIVTRTTDTTFLATQQLQSNVATLLMGTIQAIVQTLAVNFISLNNGTGTNPLGAFAPIIAQIQQITADTAGTLSNIRNTVLNNLTADIGNYTTQNTGLLSNTQAQLVIAANYTQQIAADVSNEQNNLQNLLKTTVNNQILLQESNTSLQVLNQVTAQVEAEALQNNPDAGFGDIFGGLVGFLVGVGDWTASEADKAVSGLEALTGTLANALGSAFGSVGGFVAMIFIGIVILAVIGVVIWVIVKFACKKTADPQTSQLQKDVEGLKKFTGYKEPVETTPAPAADVPKTSGKRSSNRSRSAGKVKGHRYSEVETSAV